MNYITIIGASENNLKSVSLKIPKGKITVFTGISGSGKSSLCLDTIAAESRRELNETFTSVVQQYLPKSGRPKVERIENMPVTIVTSTTNRFASLFFIVVILCMIARLSALPIKTLITRMTIIYQKNERIY